MKTGLFQDPNYLALPETDRAELAEKYLAKDPQFMGLPDADKAELLNRAVNVKAKPVPQVAPTLAPKREVGALEAGGRALGRTYANTGNMLGMAAGGAATIVDKIAEQIYGGKQSNAQDFVFKNIIDGVTKPAVDSLTINPNTEQLTTGGKVADVAGTLAGVLSQGVLMGGSSIPTTLAGRATQSAASSAGSFALPDATARAQTMIDKGVDMDTVQKAFASNAIINTAAGVLPVSAAGNVVKRAATGGALAAGSGALSRDAESRILGDQYKDLAQDQFSVEGTGVEAGIGAVIGALLGNKGSAAMGRINQAEQRRNFDTFNQQADDVKSAKAEQAFVDALYAKHEPILKANGIDSPKDPRAVKAIGILEKKMSEPQPSREFEQTNTAAEPSTIIASNNAGEAFKADAGTFAGRNEAEARLARKVTPNMQESMARTMQESGLTPEQVSEAFAQAQSRQNQADADLAEGRNISPDYQGGLSAATGGIESEGMRSVMLVGKDRNLFEPMIEPSGNLRTDEKGNVYGTITDADGNTTNQFVPMNEITQKNIPKGLPQGKSGSGSGQRLAQDFIARSSQPKKGVGEGTMQTDKMPRRSTDRISGDVYGGETSRLGDPYAPEPREPQGNVDILQNQRPQEATKLPSQGTTIDNEILNPRSTPKIETKADSVGTAKDVGTTDTANLPKEAKQKQLLLTNAQKLRDVAETSTGKEKADLTARAEKLEKQASKIKSAPVEQSGVTEVARIGGKNSTETISVRENGDVLEVLYNKEPLIDFNTEVAVTVPKDASIADIKAAVKAADQFGRTIIKYDDAYTPKAANTASTPTTKPASEPATTSTAKTVEAAEVTQARATRIGEIGDTLRAWLPSMDWQEVGGRLIRDENGNVGRTTWFPIDPEFGAMRRGLSQSIGYNISFSKIKEAVNAALDGKVLTPQQAKIVDSVIDTHDYLVKQSDEIQTELDGQGITNDVIDEMDGLPFDFTESSFDADAFFNEMDGTNEANPTTARVDSEATQTQPESTIGTGERSGEKTQEQSESFLTGETPEQLKAKADDLAQREAKLKAEQKAYDDKVAADKVEAERKARQEIAADSFELSRNGTDPKENKKVDAKKIDNEFAGQKDMLDDEPSTPDDYDADIQNLRNTLGGSTFYSGLPIDAMYKAVQDALKAMYSSDFVAKHLSDWKENNEAFNQAAKDDKKASGTDKGGFRRGLDLALDAGNRAITGQTAILSGIAKRYGDSPTINKLVTMFNDRTGTADAGESGVSYYQDIEQHFTSTINKVADVVGEKYIGNQEFWQTVTRKIKAGKFDSTPSGVAASKIAKLLADEHDRLKAGDVSLGKRDNYFPDREVNENMVINNEASFVQAATKAYIKNGSNPREAAELANNWFKAVLLGDSDALGSLFRGGQSIAPNTGFTKSRVLSESAANELRTAGFYFDNPLDSLTTYFYRTSRKTAFEKRFGGDKWLEIEKAMIAEGNIKAISDVKDLMPTLLGEAPSSNFGARGRKVTSFLQTANVITYLSGVGTLLTSLPEQVVGAARTGKVQDVPKAIYFTGRNVATAVAKKVGLTGDWSRSLSAEQSIEVAEMIGSVSHRLLNDTMLNNRLGGNMSNKSQTMLVQKVLSYNGLQGLTRSQRAAMVELGAGFMNSLAKERVGGKGGKLNELSLAELGVPKNKQDEFAKWLNNQQKAEYGGVKPSEINADNEMSKYYREALYRFNSQTIMNPNKGQQPVMASHPVGKIAYSLMSYTYAYTDAVLKRSGRLMKEAVVGKGYTTGERLQLATPLLVAAGVIPLLQYAMLPVRDLLTGTTDEQKQKRVDRTFDIPLTGIKIRGDVTESVQRSGILGKYDPIVNMVNGLKYNRDIANTLLGASAGGIANTLQSNINLFQAEKNSPNTNSTERKAASDVFGTVIEPSLLYLNARYVPAVAAVPLQLAAKNKQTREAAVNMVAGKKKQKASADGLGELGSLDSLKGLDD